MSGYKDKIWNYIDENLTLNENISEYASKVVRTTFCACLDGCQNPKRCPCYK
jgi:hypothetical protein